MDCSLHATVTGANAAPAPLVLRRRGRVARPLRWRARSVRAHQASEKGDDQAAPPVKGGGARSTLPKTTALKVGAGVALALALGGASWTARGGGPVLHDVRPAAVCALNAVTDGASRPPPSVTVRTSVDALSDSLFRREDSPRDRATLMDLVFEQVTKEHITDRGKLTSLLQKEFSASRDSERKLDLGLLLTDVLINQREWQRAKEVCQQLTGRYQRDSRPYLHLAVINMMMAVETMLSPETATTDDIEKMSKNSMDAWKEFKSKNELAKGSTDSST
ncbi:hypothetical protein PR202_gb27081 [Eleusine coracana subsp. coracana]|uniref:Uncharacterized protein n=1 Tax=Eleusine coracana subsp. coracana TaxID=191504 RepID=A0AAV5FST5_ELECO|nr:hypothetical protein QOZ80_1AG0002270 [Eleusine coracana subsp. coracana]GJN38072.1 hypothetical protein PR202_gb27081 [Eleusine coracana subsp. coracana]